MIADAVEDTGLSPQPLILGTLMLGPRHPYELFRVIDAELGRVWRLGRSHLYAHLSRLADRGLVEARTETPTRRPARNVFSITPAGEAVFREWVERPSRHVRHIRLEFLARLYFHRRLGLRGLGRLVAGQKKLLEDRAASLKAAMRETRDAYWKLVLGFRLQEMKAIYAWLDACKEKA
jgi:DNA-binding PadR family transcriptional regulator